MRELGFVIELGCGTGYVSAWLARRGARPVGIDNSPKQLETARALQREFGLEFPLLLGNAERVPYPIENFTMDPADAAWAVKELIRPKVVIPMHYGASPLTRGTAMQFTEAMGTSAVKVIVAKPGDALQS